jgi:hypothetical protein
MLRSLAQRRRKTKKSNLAPKKIASMLSGQVERRFVKCGKQRCKCIKGELHGPYFYHRTWDGNRHQKSYIRLSDVAETVKACESHRNLQKELREGRAFYKALLARAKELFR